MTEKTSHKSIIYKHVVWWVHCVKHVVLICRAAASYEEWVNALQRREHSRECNHRAGSEGRKNGSEGDKVFPFQKAWAKLCSDAYQWKKIQKRLERGRQSCPLSPTCIWCTAGGRVEDVSVIIPRTGCWCDHPRFVLCSSVMDLAIASSCIQTTFTLQIHLMPPEDGPSYCSSCTPLKGACRQHSPSSSTRLLWVWCAWGRLQNIPIPIYLLCINEGMWQFSYNSE